MDGKVSQKSIDRVSRCYQEVEEIVNKIDDECCVRKDSGSHKKVSWKEDVLELSKVYTTKQLFNYVPGRSFRSFKDFPDSLISKSKLLELKNWFQVNVLKFSKMTIYKNKQFFTGNL